jgi:DNA-binding SARP family transcriptional activator
MGFDGRRISVVGRLGIYPMMKLSLPARKLIALLALRGGEASRQASADGLWPDMTEDSGRASLRRSLWQVPRGWVSVVGENLVLEAECDLPEARAAAVRAIGGEPVTFDEIDLLSSDVLPGWHDEWVLPIHDEFRTLRVQALEAACRTLLAHGNLPLAIQAGTAALMAEPLRESAAEAVIEVHLAQHNRYEALRCYDALVKRLQDELSVQPMRELTDMLAAAGLARTVA